MLAYFHCLTRALWTNFLTHALWVNCLDVSWHNVHELSAFNCTAGIITTNNFSQLLSDTGCALSLTADRKVSLYRVKIAPARFIGMETKFLSLASLLNHVQIQVPEADTHTHTLQRTVFFFLSFFLVLHTWLNLPDNYQAVHKLNQAHACQEIVKVDPGHGFCLLSLMAYCIPESSMHCLLHIVSIKSVQNRILYRRHD